jgi:hypothetical protein
VEREKLEHQRKYYQNLRHNTIRNENVSAENKSFLWQDEATED